MYFAHERKLREFVGKINLNYFGMDLLGVILDAIDRDMASFKSRLPSRVIRPGQMDVAKYENDQKMSRY